MKPLILSAEQVRLSCQADAFLRGLVCEEFKPKGDVDFHVGSHPIKDGVRMNLGTKIGEHSFMVRRPFGSHDGTSQIFWGCEEMVVELTRSIENVTREMKREIPEAPVRARMPMGNTGIKPTTANGKRSRTTSKTRDGTKRSGRMSGSVPQERPQTWTI